MPQSQRRAKNKQNSQAEARETSTLYRIEEVIESQRQATKEAKEQRQAEAAVRRSQAQPMRKRNELAEMLKKTEEERRNWIVRELAERSWREKAELRAQEEAEREARKSEERRVEAEALALQAREREEREAEARRLKAQANQERRERAKAFKEAERKRKEANAAQELEQRRQLEEAERQAKEAEERRRLAKEAEQRRREAKLAREQAERQRREEALVREREEEERRRQELLIQRHREYADATWAHLGLRSTIVSFGAGLEIKKLVPGFETCRAQLTRLPMNVKQGRDVAQLLEDNGIPRGTFHVINTFRREATVLIASSVQDDLRAALDNVEISEDADIDGMGAANRSTIQVTLSWLFPSVSYVFTYLTVDQAQEARKRLDRYPFGGRNLSARVNQLRPGEPDMYGIIVSGFPAIVMDTEIDRLASGGTMRRLRPLIFDEELAAERFQAALRIRGVVSSKSFTEGPHSKIRAQFRDHYSAKQIYDEFNGIKFPWLGGKDVRVTLPTAFRYTLIIPAEQYRAQRQTWNDFPQYRRSNSTAGVEIQEQQDRVFIRVIGDDAKEVGQLKVSTVILSRIRPPTRIIQVRIESVARGKQIEDWTRPYVAPKFLKTIKDDSGAYVRWDYRMGQMKVYGNARSTARAVELFRAEAERLASQEISVFLKRESVSFFMRRGLQALKDMYEEDNVRLVFTGGACQVVVQGGGANAKHAVGRLIDESLDTVTAVGAPAEDAVVCPICFVEVTTPVQVASCGHSYCHNCARHCLATAAETKHFPLLCVANEGRCGTPIPIPIIQQFLIPQAFNELLEVAFVQYIERHQQEYRYCSTADCVQMYRCDPNATEAIKCPSCLTLTCPACHEAGHDGQRCGHIIAEEERLTDDFAAEQGFQRCPSCNVLLEKISGCNHVECICGTHLCWICVGIFDRGGIYQHMNDVHGGMNNGVPQIRRPPATAAPAPVPLEEVDFPMVDDYRAQVDALEMFNRHREAQRRLREAVQHQPAQEEAERRERAQRLRQWQAQEAEARDLRRVQMQWNNTQERARHREREREQREREHREAEENKGWCTIM